MLNDKLQLAFVCGCEMEKAKKKVNELCALKEKEWKEGWKRDNMN